MGIVEKTRGKVVVGDESITETMLHGARVGGTVVTAGTAVNVAHGLGSTPAIAWCAEGDAYVTTYNSTNVTVNSTQNNVDFYVYALL